VCFVFVAVIVCVSIQASKHLTMTSGIWINNNLLRVQTTYSPSSLFDPFLTSVLLHHASPPIHSYLLRVQIPHPPRRSQIRLLAAQNSFLAEIDRTSLRCKPCVSLACASSRCELSVVLIGSNIFRVLAGGENIGYRGWETHA
jgi:hypothetical protein